MDTFDKWFPLDELVNFIEMSWTKLCGMAPRGGIPASRRSAISGVSIDRRSIDE